MPTSRRHLLLAGAAAPLLAACAQDLWKYRSEPVGELARRLGICAAAFCTLKAGQPQPVTTLGAGTPGACSGPAGAVPPDTIFQAASLTKPVVAFAALRLVLAGRLDLAAPVSRYLPQGYVHFHRISQRGPGDASDRVSPATLARIQAATLLNHTAGLPNWTAGALAPEGEPGRRWRYSGEGYVLLQAVLESITGRPLHEFIDEQVFQPLGMHDSALVWQERFAARAVAGHVAGPAGGVTNAARFAYPVAASSLITTAGDYARFMAACAADEKVMALALSNPVAVDPALGLQWGYGWGLEPAAGGGVNLWQWGNNPGFRAFAMFSPASRDGFVLLTNSERGMALAVPLAAQVLPGDHHAFRFRRVG